LDEQISFGIQRFRFDGLEKLEIIGGGMTLLKMVLERDPCRKKANLFGD